MSKLAQLRAARNTKAQEAQALNAKYPADQRMPSAEASKLDTLLAEIEAIDGEIAREQRIAQLAGEQLATENPQAALDQARDRATRNPQQHSENAHALRAFMRAGVAGLNDAQRAGLNARQTAEIRAAMSTTTNTEGGFTVAPEFYTNLEVAQRAYGAMLGIGQVIRTATGATMNFPAADPTSEEGEIVGQNAPASTGETTFANLQLDVYRYSSKKIALPWELVQDEFVNLESYIQDLLAMRLGRIRGRHTTVGSGVGQPRGIVTASGVGKVGANGQTVTITYDDLIDLEHSVDPAYRALPSVGYMMHDTTLARVRKIKDSNGRPIFVPGYENGNPGGAPDRLLNRPIIVNQDMPVMAANAKSILFGAFEKYKHRQVMDLTIFRFTDSAFALNGQVGFCAFQRAGGNLIDVGGAVKAYQNSAT